MQGSDLAFMAMVAGGAIVLFAVIILIGVIMRAVKAPRGQRMREAFGPFAGAGEKYQELHTGQEGLRDSIMRTVQEQSQQGGDAGQTTGDASGKPDDDDGDADDAAAAADDGRM